MAAGFFLHSPALGRQEMNKQQNAAAWQRKRSFSASGERRAVAMERPPLSAPSSFSLFHAVYRPPPLSVPSFFVCFLHSSPFVLSPFQSLGTALPPMVRADSASHLRFKLASLLQAHKCLAFFSAGPVTRTFPFPKVVFFLPLDGAASRTARKN